MISIKTLSMRNFLSIGAVAQSLNFENQDLTMIIGENLDVGNGMTGRVGTGKTTLIQAISFAFFGEAINKIKKDNLINRTNEKGMVVTLEFSVGDDHYKIVRGRKPNVLKFIKNNIDDPTKSSDDAQGENKETQAQIEKILGMSYDIFKHIVILNTYTEPFLTMRANDQRQFIESLLGITLLSEKADKLKEQIKQTKDLIQSEDLKIKAITEANKRIHAQINQLKTKSSAWEKSYNSQLEQISSQIVGLEHIDIEQEIANHALRVQYDAYQSVITSLTEARRKHDSWVTDNQSERSKLEKKLLDLEAIDVESEINVLQNIIPEKVRLSGLIKHLKTELDSVNISGQQRIVSKLEAELNALREHKCYACGQQLHDQNVGTKILECSSKLETEQYALETLVSKLQSLEQEYNQNVLAHSSIIVPATFYTDLSSAFNHRAELNSLKQKIDSLSEQSNPHADLVESLQLKLSEFDGSKLQTKPVCVYSSLSEAHEHKNKIAVLVSKLEQVSQSVNPYTEQIRDMETKALQVTSFDKINEYTKLMEHQKFVLDLLTNKESFIRKRIIDQNINHLNSRLSYYLERIGLPHHVCFKNDLSVEITDLGRELDFHNLSRGETNRLVLALSFAFRDVWESLYKPINCIFVDELLDTGQDAVGLENASQVLKEFCSKRGKSVWVISHREELLDKVNQVLKVIKEGGFTTYEMMDSK